MHQKYLDELAVLVLTERMKLKDPDDPQALQKLYDQLSQVIDRAAQRAGQS